jgi:hypothetical protein
MQSMENDKTVSHASHSYLEDADEARDSHISTTTTTDLDKKDKQKRRMGACDDRHAFNTGHHTKRQTERLALLRKHAKRVENVMPLAPKFI